MMKFRPGSDILEEIVHIFLVPQLTPERIHLSIPELKKFLNEMHGISSIGLQSPTEFTAEECDFIVALKQNPKDEHFVALKLLVKSYFDYDLDVKLDVLYSLKQKFKFELFDGKTLEHLTFSRLKLKYHLLEMQQLKKEEFLHDLLPVYSLN